MTDDPLKALSDSMSSIRREKEASETDRERICREYDAWLTSTAADAIHKIAKRLKADGATVRTAGPAGNPPIVAIEAVYQGEPTFSYYLKLHPNTGTERAFVMRQYTAFNADYPVSGDGWTKQEEYAFFDEHAPGGRRNHAPEITEADIFADFTKLFTAHRQRDWPRETQPGIW